LDIIVKTQVFFSILIQQFLFKRWNRVSE
jgi:hypothetical protein